MRDACFSSIGSSGFASRLKPNDEAEEEEDAGDNEGALTLVFKDGRVKDSAGAGASANADAGTGGGVLSGGGVTAAGAMGALGAGEGASGARGKAGRGNKHLENSSSTLGLLDTSTAGCACISATSSKGSAPT